MKKNLIVTAMCLTSLMAMAQETYENAQLATEDLNGTARYVGMGGAMEALGADISTIGTNPAGIGLFRKSWVGASGGLTVQSGSANNAQSVVDIAGISKTGVTNADLNQIGFVYSMQSSLDSWFNIGFNYHKSRNFNMISNALNTLNYESSLNKMGVLRLYEYDELTLADDVNFSAMNDYLITEEYDDAGNPYYEYGYKGADAYFGTNENSGHINEFDINFSGSFNNQLYLGVTLGLKDVHYNGITYYDESLVDLNNYPDGSYSFADAREITGNGFDLKFGIIYRPIETSPFRIGAYIHTPTWYDLTCSTAMQSIADFGFEGNHHSYRASSYGEYKYKMTTPWKFGLSLGHTINNSIAIGATYEYADYSSIKNKIVFDDDHTVYSADYEMDRNTKEVLRGVNTLKIGMEVKPIQEMALRIGYNYVSPMYNTDGSKDINISTNEINGSNGAYFSTYDYINWKATQRLTIGMGYALTKNLNLDFSYQFSTQKGEYHPFQNLYYADTGEAVNIGTPTSIKNNRHQINATLGYRF